MIRRDFIRNVIIALIAILAIFLLRTLVFSTFKVHEDVTNSYLSNRDVVVINRNRTPQYKGSIAYEVDGTFYTSRIIATAGESAIVMDDISYIDNEVQEEPYISQIKSEYLSTSDNRQAFTSGFSVNTITNDKYSEVPRGSYLVLNDGCRNTSDSRTFGLIKESQIRGVITFKLLPLSKFGFIITE